MRNIKELFGVYVARVVDVRDPENLGRIRISSVEGGVDAWARVTTLFAGDGGGWFVPEIDHEVVVAFEAGDARRRIVVGSLWKGNRRPTKKHSVIPAQAGTHRSQEALRHPRGGGDPSESRKR